MPKFTTISPTHIPGRKKYAWERFREGRYISIGWLDDPPIDLTGISMDEIADLVRQAGYGNHEHVVSSFERFLSLEIGTFVAVNNTASGLFGIGIIESDYKFGLRKHDCGNTEAEEFYPHFRDVRWISTTYVRRKSLFSKGEKGGWQPFGTVGKVYDELPPYVVSLVSVGKTEKPGNNRSFCKIFPSKINVE